MVFTVDFGDLLRGNRIWDRYVATHRQELRIHNKYIMIGGRMPQILYHNPTGTILNVDWKDRQDGG